MIKDEKEGGYAGNKKRPRPGRPPPPSSRLARVSVFNALHGQRKKHSHGTMLFHENDIWNRKRGNASVLSCAACPMMVYLSNGCRIMRLFHFPTKDE